jgi:group I intron endonuclease
MSLIGVYVIANKVNKKVYVGASSNIKARLSAHKTQLRAGRHHCKPLQEDWKIFGEDSFDFKVLELSDGKNFVLVERKYIKSFAALNNDCLYNLKIPKDKERKKTVKRTGVIRSEPTN